MQVVLICSFSRQKALEQERLDRELALRLAAEDQTAVEEMSTEPKPNIFGKPPEDENNKYDLAKWKYADLRDTINTSCGKCVQCCFFFSWGG
jgi:myosin-6